MWIKLLIQCFLLSAAECGSHSLEFLSTGRVQSGDRPQFEQLTVFDGVPISYCDSLTRKEEFKPSLESKTLSEKCDEAIYQVLQPVYEIPKFLNNTVYIVQRRRGCILSASGVVSAFDVWAVNGMDFMSFDLESQTWTSHSPSAGQLKHRWNNNKRRIFDFQQFIRVQCPEMIQRIKLRSTHQNTELRVFAKPTADTDQALLRCHVTTTDKSVSSVRLIGDGASKASWITVTGPVPSEDGSVILRLTAGISLRENTNKYGCAVQTEGHNITVYWDGNTLDGKHLLNSFDWKIMTIILGVCCLMFTVTLITCGTICLLKCVKKKARRPPTIDPLQLEQFTRMMENLPYPDLRSVLAAFIQGPEQNREGDQWAARDDMLGDEEVKFYNAAYFANQCSSRVQI